MQQGRYRCPVQHHLVIVQEETMQHQLLFCGYDQLKMLEPQQQITTNAILFKTEKQLVM